MVEALAKDETGVSRGSPGEISGLSAPFAYRAGGLNFLNDVASGLNSLDGAVGGGVNRSGGPCETVVS